MRLKITGSNHAALPVGSTVHLVSMADTDSICIYRDRDFLELAELQNCKVRFNSAHQRRASLVHIDGFSAKAQGILYPRVSLSLE